MTSGRDFSWSLCGSLSVWPVGALLKQAEFSQKESPLLKFGNLPMLGNSLEFLSVVPGTGLLGSLHQLGSVLPSSSLKVTHGLSQLRTRLKNVVISLKDLAGTDVVIEPSAGVPMI